MVSNNIKQKSKGPPFRSGNEWFWSGKDVIQILTLPESNKATENGLLECQFAVEMTCFQGPC